MDATFLSVKQLISYVESEIVSAKDSSVMLSLHLKATMMKVSDPIIFGHVVKVFFKDVFAKHADLFKVRGVHARARGSSRFRARPAHLCVTRAAAGAPRRSTA